MPRGVKKENNVEPVVETKIEEAQPAQPVVQPSVRAVPRLTAIAKSNDMATIKSPDMVIGVTMVRSRAEKFVNKNKHLGYQLLD